MDGVADTASSLLFTLANSKEEFYQQILPINIHPSRRHLYLGIVVKNAVEKS